MKISVTVPMWAIIFLLSTAISTSLIIFEYALNGDFIHNFLVKESITVMGVILAINCASACAIYLKLNEQEERIDDGSIYKNTKIEIKHNVLFLIISFVTVIILVFLSSSTKDLYPIIAMVFDAIILIIFNLYIYALYELTIRIIFRIPSLTSK